MAKIWSGINDGSLSMLLRTVLDAENKTERQERGRNKHKNHIKITVQIIYNTIAYHLPINDKKKSYCCIELRANSENIQRKDRFDIL